MSDRYQQLTSSALGRQVAKRLGLPVPPPLKRYKAGAPVISGAVLLGAAPGGRLADPAAGVLKSVHAEIHHQPSTAGSEKADGQKADSQETDSTDGQRYAALVFDASGITRSQDLRHLHAFFNTVIRQIAGSGRLIVLGTPPEETRDARERAAQRSLEGFVRSAGKELKRGATAQLVYVSPGAEQSLDSTLRFLLSAKSAYVSGQVVRVGASVTKEPPAAAWERPLRDQIALVTGASRGIGAAIAETLARDGAHVICLDIPAQGEDLAKVANKIGGSTLQLDITATDAPDRISRHVQERFGGLDVVVHNAGITRDKTLAKMSQQQWESVLAVNLSAQEAINDVLLGKTSPLRPGARIVSVASIAGIAGNVGQTNYATSKAGVIGMVQALAPVAAAKGVTVNAVAPGFIETAMTAAIPLMVRETGRRMNSLSQGGLPIDVAETIAWFANPASTGVTGNVVRVCGQSLLGA